MGPDAHRALADVKATSTILRFDSVWKDSKENIFVFLPSGNLNDTSTTQQPTRQDDLDLDVDEDVEIDADEDDEISHDEDESTSEQRIGWQLNKPFQGFDVNQRFVEHFSKKETRGSTGDVGNTLGLQCSVNSVNSPAKAWQQIFTASILDKIVAHTNDYGEVYCKEWTDIDRQDLIDFICVLYISK